VVIVRRRHLRHGRDGEGLPANARTEWAWRIAEVINSYQGIVARYMGNGVLAYFGYPQAHEDDAEQAVRAGLALVEVAGGETPLQIRVGIATGVAVVGDLIGEGSSQEQAVVGDTPNLAAFCKR
jgi:class 3 adenylate cyclase